MNFQTQISNYFKFIHLELLRHLLVRRVAALMLLHVNCCQRLGSTQQTIV